MKTIAVSRGDLEQIRAVLKNLLSNLQITETDTEKGMFNLTIGGNFYTSAKAAENTLSEIDQILRFE